ncbi:FliM/FliN family flagellar motor switch protein [Pantoea sp.]|uniref:FliM/FliN family flagellar motor switch protein n=1 Tax=Pantoea sp. TaxID=69393 RepID=UPI0031D4AB46
MRTKSNRMRIYTPDNQPDLMKLEVNKLGRPYHKVPKVFKDNSDRFDAKLGIYFLKKFRVDVSLREMQFQMDCTVKQATIFSTEIGSLAFSLNRTLLLNILHDYYGLSRDDQSDLTMNNLPVTKTEERLQHKLASELVHLICGDELFSDTLTIKTDPASLLTQWSYRIDFFLDGYSNGNFSLLLDAAHVDRLLSTLRLPADPNRNTPVTLRPHSFKQLPVRLRGRLATLPMTVADLARLKPNDVLPIAMNDRIPLLVGDQPLFSAVICEERGKLFFSEFSDRTSE